MQYEMQHQIETKDTKCLIIRLQVWLHYLHSTFCRLPKDTQNGLLNTKDASKKLIDLGMEFISLEQIVKDSVESLRMKGYLS